MADSTDGTLNPARVGDFGIEWNKRFFRVRRLRICELKQKEVINICDCRRLGYIVDVEFDPRSGCICSFIIPGPGCICGLFGREHEYIIPFGCVRQIGEDIVLVEVNPEEIKHKCGG